MKRTTIWLDEADRQAIKSIRLTLGLDSDSSAIRMALRVLASSEVRLDTKYTKKNTTK